MNGALAGCQALYTASDVTFRPHFTDEETGVQSGSGTARVSQSGCVSAGLPGFWTCGYPATPPLSAQDVPFRLLLTQEDTRRDSGHK